MKKIVIILIVGMAITGNAFASTWDITGDGDCSDWSAGPIDGVTCWHSPQQITFNDTAPVNGTVSLHLTRTPQWVNRPNTHYTENCAGSACDYAVMTTATLGNAIAFAFTNDDTRSINTGASTGLQYISFSAITTGLSCNPPAGWNCIIGTSDTIAPITITAAASVNLNITSFFDKVLRFFI